MSHNQGLSPGLIYAALDILAGNHGEEKNTRATALLAEL